MIIFLDKLRIEEEKDEEFDKVFMVIGSFGERIFIVNYINGNVVLFNEVDFLVFEIFDFVLFFVEKFILVWK